MKCPTCNRPFPKQKRRLPTKTRHILQFLANSVDPACHKMLAVHLDSLVDLQGVPPKASVLGVMSGLVATSMAENINSFEKTNTFSLPAMWVITKKGREALAND